MSRRRAAVIAGGGTAGHVFVSLAVARALVARGVPSEQVELVGSSRGQDGRLLGGEGFALTLLPGRGIVRRFGAAAWVDNAGAVAGLAAACLLAFVRLLRERPGVVVSVGGYASVPPGLVAVLLRIPLVLVNVDATPGAAQRLLGRFAAASAVAFPGTALRHAVVTGAPLRPELTAAAGTAGAARETLGLPPGRLTVAVVGGSLGAKRLNDAALGLAERWRDRGDLTLYHVCGLRNHDEVARAATAAGLGPGAPGLSYHLVAFEDRMPSLYAAADVAVCRAGALTVAEVALAGLPAVFVPLPGAPGDHQSANAAALVDAGAALMVADEACDAATLATLLEPLLGDPARRAAMAAAASALARPDAALAVADLVLEHAR